MSALAPELGVLAATAPEGAAALEAAWNPARATVAPELFEPACRRVQDQLGLAADKGADDPALAALVDQFVLYVPDVDEELRAPLRERLGDERLAVFVEALYVVDQVTRLRLSHARLFGDESAPPRPVTGAAPRVGLADATAELHASAMRLRRLDALTTEVVRLRAANLPGRLISRARCGARGSPRGRR